MKEFEGRITISKATSNSEPEFISIEIVDSNTRKCETNLHEMSLRE